MFKCLFCHGCCWWSHAHVAKFPCACTPWTHAWIKHCHGWSWPKVWYILFQSQLVFHEKISIIKLQQHTDCKILVLPFCMCTLLFIASLASCCIFHFQCCKVVRLFGCYNSAFVQKFVKQAYCTMQALQHAVAEHSHFKKQVVIRKLHKLTIYLHRRKSTFLALFTAHEENKATFASSVSQVWF